MKFSSLFTGVLFSLASLSTTFAAKSFSASNLYYAAGLREAQQVTLLQGLQSAGVKVLRVWLDGQSEAQKGTQIDTFAPLQGDSPTAWDDTVLNRLDSFMVRAHSYGIKLSIAIHSYNALEGNKDFYGKWYGTGDFYTNADAIKHFQDRMAHVLAHVNPANGKTWAQSSEYIFAFEAQNEAMHPQGNPSALATWQCTMATSLRSFLAGNTGILITTGGGSYLATSLLDAYYSCAALDVLAIHAYGVGDFGTSTLQTYVRRAQSAGKKLIMQEWGACATNAANNNCNGGSMLGSGTRNANIKAWAAQIDAAGIPWFYWQLLPNANPNHGWNYEVGMVSGDASWATLREAGLAARRAESAFDFDRWLL
ncbi:glycoside hydrolase superfamily [Boeremia exigua]|uniref:glycoside hydrolase superfamily n=1 Tax=Boeremia exigua TaxID=749465 RepID=UPI001E8CCE56|nr:glycoside hydrolase superfamily [Boeremia exigua]KAH6639133.1 glycoside hydrolase superfamily [Boeremia exigua]